MHPGHRHKSRSAQIMRLIATRSRRGQPYAIRWHLGVDHEKRADAMRRSRAQVIANLNADLNAGRLSVYLAVRRKRARAALQVHQIVERKLRDQVTSGNRRATSSGTSVSAPSTK